MFEAFNNKHVLDVEKKVIKKKNGRTIHRIIIKEKTPDMAVKLLLLFFCLFAKFWAGYAIIAMQYTYYGMRAFSNFING